ncbi:MAG: hypothetical protein KTR31_25630 [Myxococcales bacterium]|nr:hypothetical protein [Myxococcales bacterium]
MEPVFVLALMVGLLTLLPALMPKAATPTSGWAAALGLAPAAPDQPLRGTLDGVPVVVHPPGSTPSWTVIAELPIDVPAGFWIAATPDDEDPHASEQASAFARIARAELDAIVGSGWHLQVRDYVSVTHAPGAPGIDQPHALRAPLRAAVALARALAEARQTLVAEALGQLGAALGQGADLTHTTVDGVPLEIHLPSVRSTAWSCAVVATLSRPLPAGTRVVSSEVHGATDVDVGDLFLDLPLSIDTSDPPALRDRLATDDLRGAILDLLCSWPGSVLHADRVEHRVMDLDMASAIARVVELVQLLDRP